MTEALQRLIERVQAGEPGAFADLVTALGAASPELLGEAARSADEMLRKAVIAAARGRREPHWLEAIALLARDGSVAIKVALLEAAAALADWPVDAIVQMLLADNDSGVRMAAALAAQGRRALESALVLQLRREQEWQVRRVIVRSLAASPPPAVLPALLDALAQDSDRDVSEASAQSLESLLAQLGSYPAELEKPRLPLLEEAHRRVVNLGSQQFPKLAGWLSERISHDVDEETLAGFGALLTADLSRLPRAYGVSATCEAVCSVLTGPAPRAVVLLGESGSGKTAIVHELAHRLRSDPRAPWHILRISASELLAGTHYLGEWQTRVRELVKAVRRPRRVLLYVTHLEELSEAGRSAQSDTSVATALAPHIEAGDIAVLGESTPETFRSGLGAVRSLRRLFHAIEVRSASPQETREVLRAVCEEAGVVVPEPVRERLLELADYYLAGTAQPGRAIGLLRRVLANVAGRAEPVSERDVLATLSASTGIPGDFLDDAVPLERNRIRSFFETRVMGQADAVEAVVDLVALIKAGLTDPSKPFGVLLFVGPTGVGKTELARALAELLFGDAGRLARLDMSEFSTYEAHERLIGWGAKPGLLTASVREHPFSVLLLDEIEKAHPNVFDLCLQIFDAGRLTDTQGRTTDFRRTIIIMTSNLGAAAAGDGPFGFRGQEAAADRETLLRELARWFRPEFLNRLDRVVVFRPLAAETAEKIARREVARVLERSGIARRHLSVDIEPAVLSLLLRQGYSPAFGARPLKRTVERLVLLPVAWAIAAGRVPSGSVLRLVARADQVEVNIAVPDSIDGGYSSAVDSPAPDSARVAALVERVAATRAGAAALARRKSELVGLAAAPRFWDDRPAARSILDEIYRLDGVLSALDELEKSVRQESQARWTAPASARERLRFQRRLETLEGKAQQVEFLVGCRDVRDLGDAFVSLALVSSHGRGLDGVGKLARMYAALAHRRSFEVEVLDDHPGGLPRDDTVTLLLSGAGAFALLSGEAGLHQVVWTQGGGRGERRQAADRDLVSVEVLRFPAGDAEFAADKLRVDVKPLADVAGRLLARPRLEIQLLHLPSMTAVRAWTDKPRSEALERLRLLLRARIDAATASAAASGPSLVRRYVLGPAAFVRDLRLNRTTGRLDKVLQGHLDPFLLLKRAAGAPGQT
jgi:ATP-dependent Clp protease ATP-binding subunit ClpC